MVKEKENEKPVPICCVCGRNGVVVEFKKRRMVSCSDPENCVGNFMTGWNRSEDAAVEEWNTLIMSYRV